MKRIALAAALAIAAASCAREQRLEIDDVWARDTLGRTANAAVFMTIRSDGPDRLVAASTPAARKTDLMTMTESGGSMGMDYVAAIDIPAGRPVALRPDGLHVWLAGLTRPLKAGETIPLTLRFEKAGERSVSVSVLEPTARPPGSAMAM